MRTNNLLHIWQYASIEVMDIRPMRLTPDEQRRSYLLPTSSFLYVARGNAHIWLDGQEHEAHRFHVLHGGKGMHLDIAAESLLEYYMIDV